MHHGEQIRTQKAADHVIVIGCNHRRIGVVHEDCLYRRSIKLVEGFPQLRHIYDAGGASQRTLQHQVRALDCAVVQREAATGRELQPSTDFFP